MTATSPITLSYAGIPFNVITDTIGNKTPVPLINIDVSCEKDKNGVILNINNNINMNGFIIGTGIKSNLLAYDQVVDFFTDATKQAKTFRINCDGNTLIEFSGTTFESASAGTSENNWVVTLPYTIALSSVSAPSGQQPIESYDDSWTIEPISEISYYNVSSNSPYYAYRNISIPTDTPPSSSDLTVSTSPTFNVSNVIQYRITHRLSATGKQAIGSGNNTNPNVSNEQKILPYQFAAMWVRERASSINPTNSTSLHSGLIINNDAATLRLYNHVRTVETSISEGSYSLTDTWLALNTGVSYTEDFTWEISSDEKYTRTVSLNGTINGLETVSSLGYTVFPSASLTGDITSALVSNFPNQSRSNNKFNNALAVFTSSIKPSLYRRACTAIHLSSGNYLGVKRAGILNVTPVSYTESLNPAAGTIGYSITFNDNPPTISGALSTQLTVQDTFGSDQVAETFVLGRPLGPVLTKVGTQKSERRLTLEIVYAKPTGFREMHPNSPFCVIHKDRAEYKEIRNMIDAFRPINPIAFSTLVPTSPYAASDAGVVYKTSDSQTWQAFEGRLNCEVSWIYTTGNCANF